MANLGLMNCLNVFNCLSYCIIHICIIPMLTLEALHAICLDCIDDVLDLPRLLYLQLVILSGCLF